MTRGMFLVYREKKTERVKFRTLKTDRELFYISPAMGKINRRKLAHWYWSGSEWEQETSPLLSTYGGKLTFDSVDNKTYNFCVSLLP